jgi:predicted kinase
MKRLVIIRGPSGTGKSTIAAAVVRNAEVDKANKWNPAIYGEKLCSLRTSFHETDQFFTDSNGVYYFHLDKLKRAHNWNQLQVERSMLHCTEVVIVANTFIALWEMEHYLELAEIYDYDVEIIRTPGPWDADVLFERNAHDVPLDVIRRHIAQYAPTEEETEWTDLSIFQI